MKEDKCPQDSSSSKDREDQRCPSRAIGLLSDIRKYLEVPQNRRLSKGNVELGLEIEINESLKHVLTSQNSDSDDLLDVTIIRPSDSDVAHETTVALNKEEVRDFISLVEQHHENKLKCTKRKHRDSAPSKPKIKETKTQTAKHTKDSQQETDQVKPKHEKPGTPCVCQHCGVMGVLVQSQKTQIVDYPVVEDRRQSKDDKKSSGSRKREKSHETKESNRSCNSGGSTNSMDQVQLLREINARIKNLEKRLSVQEETAVPREYLKHVLHKILTQYKSKQDCQIKKENKTKTTATQYVAEIREPKYFEYRKKPYDVQNVFDDPMTNPLLRKTKITPLPVKSCISDSASSNTIVLPPHKSESPRGQTDIFWFWGEEIVKPGCDLKTKILGLLNDTMKPTIPTPEADRENDKTPEKLPKSDNMPDIRVERDDKLLMLGNMNEISPCNIDDYVLRSKPPALGSNPTKLPVKISRPPSPEAPTKSTTRPPTPPSKYNPYSQKSKEYGVINTLPSTNTHYPFDTKRTLDDSTFKKNIEAQKEKLKEKQVSKHLQDTYKTITPADTTTMATALERMTNQFRSTQGTNDPDYQVFDKTPMSTIRHNMNKGFRTKKFEPPVQDLTMPVDVTYINPKVTHWSEESTASEDKYNKMKANERNERPPVETKESLIYKLEFLKNLAKHKSADQSKVLNKIWNQAKKTAKSKNDAVFIKIPFKSINSIEPRHNVIEMQLTLEQLETVVQSVKENNTSTTNLDCLKSTSDIDVGQRRHEEIKRANAAILDKRRQMSAKTNKSKK